MKLPSLKHLRYSTYLQVSESGQPPNSSVNLKLRSFPCLRLRSLERDRTAASCVSRENQGRRGSVKPRRTTTPPPTVAKPARIDKLVVVRDHSRVHHADDHQPSVSSRRRHTNVDLHGQAKDYETHKHHESGDEQTRRRTITLPQREPERSSEQNDRQDLAIKDWAARTRRCLEILLVLVVRF